MILSAQAFSAADILRLLWRQAASQKKFSKNAHWGLRYVKELASVRWNNIDSAKASNVHKIIKDAARPWPVLSGNLRKGKNNRRNEVSWKNGGFRRDWKPNRQNTRQSTENKPRKIREKYGVHPVLNCPDIQTAEEMVKACNKISAGGDSAAAL